jgi:hypothetical protein
MTLAEAIETTRIHRVADLTGDRTAWVTTRPFRAPQHTSSDVGRKGPRRASNVVSCEIDAVGVDMPLKAIFADLIPECTLAQFKPASR